MTAGASPLKNVFDVWHDDGVVEFFSGSIKPKLLLANQTVETPVYFMKITNLQDKYRENQSARMRLFVRNKFWSPTIYTKATQGVESSTIQSASYEVYRILDGFTAIPYGTGSDLHTMLSYDVSGNYFDFDMSLLEPGYAYGFKFSFYDPALSTWLEQPYVFKFRVEDYEY